MRAVTLTKVQIFTSMRFIFPTKSIIGLLLLVETSQMQLVYEIMKMNFNFHHKSRNYLCSFS